MLLMFSPHSTLAGKMLALKAACLVGDQSAPQFQPKYFEVLRRFYRIVFDCTTVRLGDTHNV
jgi:hypothetical protein